MSSFLRGSSFVLAVAASLAVAVACGRALSEPAGEELPPRSDGGGEGGGPTDCRCMPEVPADWTGPFVADELAECSGAWNEDAGAPVYTAFDAGAHACSCTCAAEAPTCFWSDSYQSTCTVHCGLEKLSFASLPGCFGANGNCSQYVRAFADFSDGGTPCQPDAGEIHEPPGWTRTARRCGAPIQKGVCENAAQPCVPEAPSTGAICIAHAGDVPTCPPAYAKREVFYERYEDTRSCTACTCGDAGAPCDVGWFDDATCATRSGTIDGLCRPRPSTAQYAKLVRAAQACTANGGAKTGEAAPRDPITICCRAP
jgi:hypothetical protein